MYHPFQGILFCILLFSHFLVTAQVGKKLIDIKEIEDTLSIGSYLSLDIGTTPVSISVITAEQIESSGARHLSELLEIYVPGFQYMYNKWNGIIWGMRGVASDRNTKFIFLVNGHKMNQESRDGANTEFDLGFLSDLDRVEVLRGPAGLVYGSGSIAGVINLVTKKYAADKTVSESRIETWSMRTYGGSQRFLFARQLSNGGTLQLYAGLRRSDGTGMGNSRIYGRPSWPYPQNELPPYRNETGVPSVGSSWDTPGNFILSADYEIKKWRVYARITHQVTNASGFFVRDPWPGIEAVLDSSSVVPPGYVDGLPVHPGGPFGKTEAWGDNRRQYKVNNITLQVSRDLSLLKNTLKVNGAMDLVSNQIALQQIPEYSNSSMAREVEAFGEKRISLTGTYIIKRNSFDLASGINTRIFDFGNDFSGRNAQNGNQNHPIITNITYINQAAFSEGILKLLQGQLILDAGVRCDLHSRGGLLTSSRLAMIISPKRSDFNVRVVYQSSGNFGSVDNYEFNRNNFNDSGGVYKDPHYEHPGRPPGTDTPVIPVIRAEDLKGLNPEKAYSIEFSGLYQKRNFRATSSVSYNTIKDLFTWNQALFRVINAGKYRFANGEIELQYSHPEGRWAFGVSHVISKLVCTDTTSGMIFGKKPSYSIDTLQDLYSPDQEQDSIPFRIYPIRDAISVDGKNFLNLVSNTSKVYADYAVSKSFFIHSDWRIFWGLSGRKMLHRYKPNTLSPEYNDAYKFNNYNYLNFEKSLMVKWNASVRFVWKNTTFQLFIYDILAPANPIRGKAGYFFRRNSIRWQQMSNSKLETDLYAVDFRSYGLKVTVEF